MTPLVAPVMLTDIGPVRPEPTGPLFLTVTFWAVPNPLPRIVRNVRDVGEAPSFTPLRVKLTGDPLTGTLAPNVRLPAAAPNAVGRNTTLMVQELLPARVAPQVPPDAARENGPENVRLLMPVAVAPPELVRVRVCEARVV